MALACKSTGQDSRGEGKMKFTCISFLFKKQSEYQEYYLSNLIINLSI